LSLLLDVYLERAAEARRQAGDTALTKVRDRCLRSALAFEEMADHLRMTEAFRAEELARKAALPAA
jgi:hypothetical protein